MITWCSNNIVILYVSEVVVLVRGNAKCTNLLSVNWDNFVTVFRHANLVWSPLAVLFRFWHWKLKFFNFILFILERKNYVFKTKVCNVFGILLFRVLIVVPKNNWIWFILKNRSKSIFHLKVSELNHLWAIEWFKMGVAHVETKWFTIGALDLILG